MTVEQLEKHLRALEISFQMLLKNVELLQGGHKMANKAKRDAIADAKVLDSGDLSLPAQVELLYGGVKSDRIDGT